MKNKLIITLGILLLLSSLITFVSLYAVGHELSIKNFETLIAFIIIFIYLISGSLLLLEVFAINKVIDLRKIIILFLFFTLFSFAYMLYEFSDVKTESSIDYVSLIISIISILNIKVLYDFIKLKKADTID